ncbi:MAG: hypothetical protein U0841_19480 [Chloroflexia bacterium]
MSSSGNADDIGQLLADLGGRGFLVGTVAELPQRHRRYTEAIPVLLHWLPKIADSNSKLDIVQAVAVRWARPSPVGALVDEYRLAAGDPTLQWMLGDALSRVADEHHFEEIAALAKHRRYGKAREMVVVALGNMHDDRAVTLLLELLGDEEVAGHAVIALGKLRAQEARGAVEAVLAHPKAWVRTEAKRALAKIERASRQGRVVGNEG